MKMFLLAFLFTISAAFGQSNINDLTSKKITVNGKIEVNSTTEASRPCPPMTEAQRNAISSPATSGCVYNTSALALNVWNGTTWGSVGGGLSSWATAFNYNAGDVVIESNKIYKCLISHTSGTFATDLANGDWIELSAGITSTGTINDNRAVRYDGTTGNLIQSSGVTIDDSNNVSGIANLTATGTTTLNTSLSGVGKFVAGVLSASTILNADINASAAIDYSKLASLSTGQMIFGNGGVATAGTISGGFTINNAGVATLGNTAVTGQALTGYVSGAGTISATDTILQAIQKLNANDATNANLTGEVTSVGNATTVTNAAVISKVLTAYASGAGVVSASDTILQAIQKLNGNDALKQPLATLTSKGDFYVATAASTVTRLGGGGDGQIIVNDSTDAKGWKIVDQQRGRLSSIWQFNALEILSGTWGSGNSATFFASGTLAGTFAKETTTPLSNTRASYKYTQAAGSLNDWISSTAFTVPKSARGRTYFISIPYSYDGNSNDIVPVIYRPSTSSLLELSSTLGFAGTNGAGSKSVWAITFPANATNYSVQLGFHVKALNSGKIFEFGDVDISDDLPTGISYQNLTGWASYTPTFTGWGTVSPSTNMCKWKRAGEDMLINCFLTTGTVSAAQLTMTLPGTSLIDPLKLNVGNTVANAGQKIGIFAQGGNANSNGYVVTATGTSNSLIYFSNTFTGTTSLTPALGNQTYGSSFTSIDIRVPIQGWSETSQGIALANDLISSDSMNFVFKSTAITDADPVGTYNTYKKTASSSSGSQTLITTAPTQTAASMNANGFLLTAVNYATAGSDGTPSRIDIKIGKNLKNVNLFAYDNVAKPAGGEMAVDLFPYSSSEWHGVIRAYSETTGILTIEAGNNNSSISTRGFLRKSGSTAVSTGYFVINASKTAEITAIPDVTCTSIDNCKDTYTASVNATSAIDSDNRPGWVSCSRPGTGNYVCTFALNIFTVAPSCSVTTPSGAARIGAYATAATLTTFSYALYDTNVGSGAPSNQPATITCSKQGADSRGKTVQLATSIGVPTIPGVVGLSTGERIDTFSVNFGTTNVSTPCSSSPCFIDQIGSAVTSVTRTGVGLYQLNTAKTYVKLKCSQSTSAAGGTGIAVPFTSLSCSSCNSLSLQTVNNASSAYVEGYGLLMCQGMY